MLSAEVARGFPAVRVQLLRFAGGRGELAASFCRVLARSDARAGPRAQLGEDFERGEDFEGK
jgi:hypothetical protein